MLGGAPGTHPQDGCRRETYYSYVAALREARRQRMGHNPLAHLRREAYAPAACGYPAGSFTTARDPNGNRTVEENDTAIRGVLQQKPYDGRPG